jgi:hypothetical protein
LVNVLSPTTAHYIMLDFRKWRRMREIMLKRLEAKTIRISATKDEGDMKALFSEAAMETLLHLREGTAIGRRRETEETRNVDDCDISMLDRGDN